MKRSTMLLAAGALVALGTICHAQTPPLKQMPGADAPAPAPTPAAVVVPSAAPCVSMPCATCTDCSERVGGCVIRLRNVHSNRGSSCGECCSTSVACTSCTSCPTCTPTCPSCDSECDSCSAGCHRKNCLRSIIEWLTYCPVKTHGCDKRPNPCCTPPLYTFFLCQGCDNGCAIAGYNDCSCEDECTSGKHGRHARKDRTCDTCDSCATCDTGCDAKPKVWLELKCLKRYQ